MCSMQGLGGAAVDCPGGLAGTLEADVISHLAMVNVQAMAAKQPESSN